MDLLCVEKYVFRLPKKGAWLQSNVRRILSGGLLVRRAIGYRRVWLATYRKIPWAYFHVSHHHRVPINEMVLLRVDLPWRYRKFLYRWRRGVWCCRVDVPASCLRIERR